MPSEARAVWGDLAATAFVESSPLFRSLDDEARQDLLQVAEQLSFQQAEVVVREGEPGEEMYMVREGEAAVVRGGREVAVLDRGAVFGEFVAMGAPVRTATVLARTDLAVVRFSGAVVVALAARFPKVGRLLELVRAARERGSP
jgi:CRP-like cAMP-binding protein